LGSTISLTIRSRLTPVAHILRLRPNVLVVQSELPVHCQESARGRQGQSCHASASSGIAASSISAATVQAHGRRQYPALSPLRRLSRDDRRQSAATKGDVLVAVQTTPHIVRSGSCRAGNRPGLTQQPRPCPTCRRSRRGWRARLRIVNWWGGRGARRHAGGLVDNCTRRIADVQIPTR